jgi:hypothetical protein
MNGERELYATWAFNGIKRHRPDLTEEQAVEVLEMVLQNSEDLRLCLDSLELWIDTMFPKRNADSEDLAVAATGDGIGAWYG